MSNSPTRQYLNQVSEPLEAIVAESASRDFEYYVGALMGDATIEKRPGKEKTRRASYCDVCRSRQDPGSPKYWYKDGSSSFWFYPCESCIDRILKTIESRLVLQLNSARRV